MNSRHDINQAFETLMWIARAVDPGKRLGLGVQMEIARTLYIAMPRDGKMAKLDEMAKTVRSRLDLSTVRGNPEGMRTMLQMDKTINAMTDGLERIADNKKPFAVFYKILAEAEMQQDIARTVKAAITPIAVKEGPIRRLVSRMIPQRRARLG